MVLVSGDSNVTEQSSQGHLMAGKGDQQVGQSWCEGSRSKDRDQEEKRPERGGRWPLQVTLEECRRGPYEQVG